MDGRNRAAVAALVKEAEALTKEGKADIQGLKGSVLKIAEAVPGSAWRGGQWRRVSYPSWRTFVRSAIGPRELMQVSSVVGGGGKISGFVWCCCREREKKESSYGLKLLG